MTPVLTRRTFILATVAVATACLRTEPTGLIRLAAGDPGGLYLAFAELVAAAVRSRYPGVAVEVRPTEGSVENLALLRSGGADMGLALADATERDRASGPIGTAPVAVARVYENYLQVIVRDSAAAQDISDSAGKRVSIGPDGSGAAATSRVLLAAAELTDRIELQAYHLKEALTSLADGSIDALVWSGGVPTPAIADLDATLPLRTLDIGRLAKPMSALSGYPYTLRRVPTCSYVPPGIDSIGVPNLLLCRPDTSADLVAAMVNVLDADAPRLVPPHVRGLQYLDAPSMIQTGSIPMHSAAAAVFRGLHG